MPSCTRESREAERLWIAYAPENHASGAGGGTMSCPANQCYCDYQRAHSECAA